MSFEDEIQRMFKIYEVGSNSEFRDWLLTLTPLEAALAGFRIHDVAHDLGQVRATFRKWVEQEDR